MFFFIIKQYQATYKPQKLRVFLSFLLVRLFDFACSFPLILDSFQTGGTVVFVRASLAIVLKHVSYLF